MPRISASFPVHIISRLFSLSINGQSAVFFSQMGLTRFAFPHYMVKITL